MIGLVLFGAVTFTPSARNEFDEEAGEYRGRLHPAQWRERVLGCQPEAEQPHVRHLSPEMLLAGGRHGVGGSPSGAVEPGNG